MIYKALENPENGPLSLIPMDRDETIKAFTAFKEKTENKTMY